MHVWVIQNRFLKIINPKFCLPPIFACPLSFSLHHPPHTSSISHTICWPFFNSAIFFSSKLRWDPFKSIALRPFFFYFSSFISIIFLRQSARLSILAHTKLDQVTSKRCFCVTLRPFTSSASTYLGGLFRRKFPISHSLWKASPIKPSPRSIQKSGRWTSFITNNSSKLSNRLPCLSSFHLKNMAELKKGQQIVCEMEEVSGGWWREKERGQAKTGGRQNSKKLEFLVDYSIKMYPNFICDRKCSQLQTLFKFLLSRQYYNLDFISEMDAENDQVNKENFFLFNDVNFILHRMSLGEKSLSHFSINTSW